MSSDAARNLSTADSLLAGKGFVDMVGSPLVLWPPLYPILLAGLSLVTGLRTFQVAWYLNVALYGTNIWLAGWWLFAAFRRQTILCRRRNSHRPVLSIVASDSCQRGL